MALPRQRRFRPVAKSRLTSKGQATVPALVRRKLNLRPGDTVIFEESEAGLISLRKAQPLDLEFPVCSGRDSGGVANRERRSGLS